MRLYEQSGIIPFRIQDEKTEILIITTINGKNWTIPKGLIEPQLSTTESAIQEGYEEAGIKGYLYPNSIGEYRYKKWQGVCRVQVFPFRVEKILRYWPEASLRTRKWVLLDTIESYIKNKDLCSIIMKLPKHLEKSQ